jgi:hypothetical protein
MVTRGSFAKAARVSRLAYGLVLVVLAGSTVACSRETPRGEGVGEATVAISLAPPSARCFVIEVSGSQEVTRQFDVVQERSSVFVLDGLPLGADTFTANAYPFACAGLGGDAATAATWVSDPVTVTIVAGAVVAVTLEMHPAQQSSEPDAGRAVERA